MSIENESDTPEMERALLATLCQRSAPDSFRLQILRLLSAYNWQSADHRAIHDALAHWNAGPPEIRRNLAARLTRLGFPEIDIEPLFEPVAEPMAALEWLIAQISQQSRCSDSPAGRIHRSR